MSNNKDLLILTYLPCIERKMFSTVAETVRNQHVVAKTTTARSTLSLTWFSDVESFVAEAGLCPLYTMHTI